MGLDNIDIEKFLIEFEILKNQLSLDHGNLTGLTDDDHTQYWVNGVDRTGDFSTTGTISGINVTTGADPGHTHTIASIPTIGPIGSVVAWLKSYTNTPALTAGWVEMNGQTLSDADSVYNGQVIPNLNASGGGTQRFLRGCTASNATGGTECHTHSLSSNVTCNHCHYHSVCVSSSSSYGGYYSGSSGCASCCYHCHCGTTNLIGHCHDLTGDTGSSSNLPNFFNVVWIMRIK